MTTAFVASGSGSKTLPRLEYAGVGSYSEFPRLPKAQNRTLEAAFKTLGAYSGQHYVKGRIAWAGLEDKLSSDILKRQTSMSAGLCGKELLRVLCR